MDSPAAKKSSRPPVRVTGFGQVMFLLGRGHRPISVHQQAHSNTASYVFPPEARVAIEEYFVVRDSLSDVPVVSR
jgi:hypothetical protein